MLEKLLQIGIPPLQGLNNFPEFNGRLVLSVWNKHISTFTNFQAFFEEPLFHKAVYQFSNNNKS